MTDLTRPVWHADDDLLFAYALDAVDDPLADSLEDHLLRCVGCRSALASRCWDATGPIPRKADLEDLWRDIDRRLARVGRSRCQWWSRLQAWSERSALYRRQAQTFGSALDRRPVLDPWARPAISAQVGSVLLGLR